MSTDNLPPNAPEAPIAPPGGSTEDPAHPDPPPESGSAPQQPAQPTPGSAEGGERDEPGGAAREGITES